ncbi:ribosomal RNA small subunit methyltransferase H [Bacteroidia bacterium]|nr:ribosomal RNA small subunit methyltransferase H [Bacteroidia bacterium]
MHTTEPNLKTADSRYHLPVLLCESVDGLQIEPSGTYVDMTFGGGGHSIEMLKRLNSKGRVIAFDQDADAQKNAAAVGDKRLTLVQSNFRFFHNHLHRLGIAQVNGVLGDLGVSWHQFDSAQRGFSFRFDAPLDMRMNQQSALTASDIVNNYAVENLTRIFTLYGELDKAYSIAKMIVQARNTAPLNTINDLLNALKNVLPKFDEHKYLAKIFQALRIEVNGEMRALEQALQHCTKSITAGGRMVMITYHSLEDRIVKNFIKTGNAAGEAKKDMFGATKVPFAAVNKKVILPAEQEIASNSRARSAKLRIAERQWIIEN